MRPADLRPRPGDRRPLRIPLAADYKTTLAQAAMA
jgi:hypothetical protein